MKLRRNEFCPIHRSLFCCGREQARKEHRLQLGVQRVEDPHHPRGYRELWSPGEMRKLLNRRSWSRMGNVQSVTSRLPTTARSFPTTSSSRGWEALGQTTTPQCSGSPSTVQSPEGIEKIMSSVEYGSVRTSKLQSSQLIPMRIPSPPRPHLGVAGLAGA